MALLPALLHENAALPLEDPLTVVRQWGVVPFDQHHLVAASLHHAFSDGTLGAPRIHGHHPALHAQPAPHILQDWDRLGLVRHRLWPQGQSPSLAEPSSEMDSRATLLPTAPQRFPIDGQRFPLAYSWG
jgi:hypothetical protein